MTSPLKFTLQHTQWIKCVAIILMLYHHLFSLLPIQLDSVSYYSIFPEFTVEVAEFGKICVAMFLFVNGYGLSISSTRKPITFKNIHRRISKFLIHYWVVLIVFLSFGAFFLGKDITLSGGIADFLTIKSNYNRDWWFVAFYVRLLVLLPFILYIHKHFENGILLFLGLYLFSLCSPTVLPERLQFFGFEARELLLWQLPFNMGVFCCRKKLFTKLDDYIIRRLNPFLSKYYWIFLIFLTCGLRELFERFVENPVSNIGWFAPLNSHLDFLCAPLFIFALSKAKELFLHRKWIDFIALHSTNIWLTHYFFMVFYSQKLIYAPHFDLLILAWLFLICIVVSIGLFYLQTQIITLIKGSRSRLRHLV